MTRKEIKLIDAIRNKTDEEMMKCFDDMTVSEIRSFLLDLIDEEK